MIAFSTGNTELDSLLTHLQVSGDHFFDQVCDYCAGAIADLQLVTAVPALIELFDQPGAYYAERAVVYMGPVAQAPVLQALPIVLATALTERGQTQLGRLLGCISELRITQAIPLLVEALQRYHDHLIVGRWLFTTIRLLGDPSARNPVFQLWQTLPDPELRGWGGCVETLAGLDDPRMLSVLLTMARDSAYAYDRMIAMQYLPRYADVRIRDVLLHGLTDPSPDVRFEACLALGAAAYRDVDLLGAIRQVADTDTGQTYDRDEVRWAALLAYGVLSDDWREPDLQQAVAGYDGRLLPWMLKGLASLATPWAKGCLKTMVHAAPAEGQALIIETMGAMKDEEFLEDLLTLQHLPYRTLRGVRIAQLAALTFDSIVATSRKAQPRAG